MSVPEEENTHTRVCVSLYVCSGVGGLSVHPAITTAGIHSVFAASGTAVRVLQVFVWKHTCMQTVHRMSRRVPVSTDKCGLSAPPGETPFLSELSEG